MSKLQHLLTKLVEKDLKQPAICMVRKVDGIYIDVEPINSPSFNEDIGDPDNYITNVRLTLDQQPIEGDLQYNTPKLNSRVLVVWTEDEIPIAIKSNRMEKNTSYDLDVTTHNVNLKTKQVLITIDDNLDITTKKFTIDADNFDVNLTNKLEIKNNIVSLTDILNNIYNSINIINGKVAGVTGGPTGAEPLIAQVQIQIQSLFK